MENSYVTSISFFYGLNEDELIDWRLMFPGSTCIHPRIPRTLEDTHLKLCKIRGVDRPMNPTCSHVGVPAGSQKIIF